MHESIDLTVSRAGIKLCIRKNTHQYSLQANLGSRSSKEDGQKNKQYGQMPSSASHGSQGDELVLSTAKPVHHKKVTHEYKDKNQDQEKYKYRQIANFYKSNTHGNHYNEYNSSRNSLRIYLKDRLPNNSSVDYTSGSEKSLTSSDYDADDEDIEITSKNLSNCERKCMSRLCDLLSKNDDINLEGKNKDLRTFIESIFLDDKYNAAGEGNTLQKDFHLSKEKLDKLLQKMCHTQLNEVGRQKRESNTNPQLALLIPMIHEEVNESGDPSKRFKRCIKKSCRKSICQNLGCYANKGSYEAISPEISVETNYREIAANKKMPFIPSNDSTLHNDNSYPENNFGTVPFHHLKFASKQNIGRNHRENDISKNKFSKLLVNHQERKNEVSEKLQDKSSLYDDLKDNESSVSLQTRLEDTAHHLKKLLEKSRERNRNQKRPQYWNDQHQMTYFPHETDRSFDSLSQKMDTRKFVENKADEYLSLPKGSKQMESQEVLNQHQENQFNSKSQSEYLSSATQTDSPTSLKQEHGNMNLQPRAETELNPMFSEARNNMYSSFHPSSNVIQQPNLSSAEGYSSNNNLHSYTGQVQERVGEDNPQMKDNALTTRDLSTFDYLYSTDNEEHQFPVKLNNSSSFSKTHNNALPSITGPMQLMRESIISENTDILQQVNLQEIYKNLPPNYEFSAGQWIRVQPSEGTNMPSGKVKSIDKGTNDRGTNDFEGYDYNIIYSQLNNQSENNAKVVVAKHSDPSEQLISSEKLKNGTGNFQETITNEAEQVLEIYRSQGNLDSTELKSQYEDTKNDESNFKTDSYSSQDEANHKSRYLTSNPSGQLIAPVSFITNVKANENMSEVTLDLTTEKIFSSLQTPYTNSQQEKPTTSNMEKQWETNDQFYGPEYQNNMQYHENKNDKKTTNIHHLTDESYLKKITETRSNENDQKIIKQPFGDKEELTTSSRKTSNLYYNDGTDISDTIFPSPLLDITKNTVSQTMYSISPNESELQRNVFQVLSKETRKNETALPGSPENTGTNIKKIHSEHSPTNEYSKQQYLLTTPRVSSVPEDLLFEKAHKPAQNEPKQVHGNKIPHSDIDFKKFVSESNLNRKQMKGKSWNGTPHIVVQLLNEMLENPKQDAIIENTTPYNSSEWTFTSTTDKVPSLTEDISRPILHSGSEEIHRSNSRVKEILHTSPEFRGETSYLQNLEGNRRNVFQNYQPMSPYHTNYPETIDIQDRDTESVFQPNLMTYDSKKSSILENVAQNVRDNDFGHRINNLPQNFTLEAIPTKDDVSEQNEYSGTILIVDPSTGAVAETIPVTGRFLSLNSENHGKDSHAGAPHPSLQSQVPTYLQPNSQESYTSTFYNDDSFESKYPQEIHKGYTYNPPQIIQSAPHATSTKNEWHKFEFPSKDNHSIGREKIVDILPQKNGADLPANSVLQSKYYPKQRNHIVEHLNNDSQSRPSSSRGKNYELSPNVMDDSSQIKSDAQISLRIPSKVNVTCLVKDLPCETAKDDVYRNFFRVMLKEMQKLGEGNCATCTNSTLIPACENCIRRLIHEGVSEHSMNEEVENYAVNHCPQIEAIDNRKDTSPSTDASTSPYTKCKYKFIADLTSLFGLWLKAITNSR